MGDRLQSLYFQVVMTITKILVKRFETAGKNLPTENLTFR